MAITQPKVTSAKVKFRHSVRHCSSSDLIAFGHLGQLNIPTRKQTKQLLMVAQEKRNTKNIDRLLFLAAQKSRNLQSQGAESAAASTVGQK